LTAPTNALISLEKNTKLEFYGEESRAIYRLERPIPVRLA
jgi:ferredoxin-NADP reductase